MVVAANSPQESESKKLVEPTKAKASGYDEKFWCTVGAVGCGAVLGYLARHYLGVWVGTYYFAPEKVGRHAILVKELMPNAVGCFVMGLFVELRTRLQPMHPAMYAAITTGFCGCCTTFSSYNSAVAKILLKTPNFGDGLICAILAYILGMMTAWCSLQVGRSMTRPALPALDALEKSFSALSTALQTNGTTKEQVEKHLESVGKDAQTMKETEIELIPNPPAQMIRAQVVMFWSALLGLTILIISLGASNDHHVTKLLISVAAAPFGAWIRYILGLRNVGCTVPWYTMLCNLSAAALSAALMGAVDQECFDTSERVWWSAAVISGISSGFCGSLSTVSTLCDETRRLGEKNERRAWGYVMATILGGQVLSTIVLVGFYSARNCW